MGVKTDYDYRIKRAKGQAEKSSFRSRRASNSAFNYKVKQGHQPKSWGYKPSNEVAFKITGAGTTLAGINNSIEYITREGELQGYCYDGQGTEFSGQGKLFNQIATDSLAEGNDYNKKYAGENIAHVKNLVFSPPPKANVSRKDLIDSVVQTMKKNYAGHAFVAVYHEDKKEHPHVHVNFKLLNEETGKRLDLDKSACRKIRVDFCHSLQEKGYDVAANFQYSPELKHEIEHHQSMQPKERQSVYRVVYFGQSMYNGKGKYTPFIEYETLNKGKRVKIWGQDLKNHFEPEKLTKGALVKIKKLEPTTIRSPLYDNKGEISGYRESKRNNWHIENINVKRDRSYQIEKIITLHPDEKQKQLQLARKLAQRQSLALTAKHGFLQNSPEHKAFKKMFGLHDGAGF
ncbi:hypothetical protein CBG25_15085 [Arsenophonus sp. ENCA]|uniref:MobP1 family relaxase n=1 Tax=Arsenophonus sp. ENCA TaxID=1987579 RepID=UPI000BC9D46A|nr:MobP1 family relaxase [Arsenophonus sp. ENCA]PAV01716.1 hypothetical protein CBG25_15085 [Arsenophonus sp. ENCA]